MAPNTPAPTPWNTKAEQIVAGARRKYLTEGANFDLAEQQAKQEFGLEGPSEAAGAKKRREMGMGWQGGPAFNDYKANPFSRAALLEESYRNANRGTVNAAGMQLYAGSTSNALGSNRRVYDQSRDELAKAYQEALGEISAGRAKAAEERAEREREAEWERISAAEGAELDPEAAPSGGGRGRSGNRQRRRQRGPGVSPRRKAR